MSTTLAKQLYQATGGFSRDLKDLSFMFEKEDAVDMDIETVTSLAQSGLIELEKLNGSFGSFRDALFSPEVLEKRRELQTQEENDQLDENIANLLRALSPYFLLRSAHKLIEFLVRKHRAHLNNAESMIECALPFHTTPHFVRLVQICNLKGKWKFLMSVKKQKIPLAFDVLVNECFRNLAVYETLCDMAVRTDAPRVAIQLWVTVSIQMANRPDDIKQETLLRMLPSILKMLKSEEYREQQVAASMVTVALTKHMTLAEDVLSSIVRSIIRKFDVKDGGKILLTLLAIFESQHLTALQEGWLKYILKIEKLVDRISELANAYDVGSFLRPLLVEMIADSCTSHSKSETVLKDLIRKPFVAPHVSVLVNKITQCMQQHKKVASNKAKLSAIAHLIGQVHVKETDAAVSALLTSNEQNEDKEFNLRGELLTAVFSGTRHCPLLLPSSSSSFQGATTLLQALTHSSAAIRLAALKELSSAPSIPEWSCDLVLSRLSDTSYEVPLAVLSLPNLATVCKPEALFAALSASIGVSNRTASRWGLEPAPTTASKFRVAALEFTLDRVISSNPELLRSALPLLLDFLLPTPMESELCSAICQRARELGGSPLLYRNLDTVPSHPNPPLAAAKALATNALSMGSSGIAALSAVLHDAQRRGEIVSMVALCMISNDSKASAAIRKEAAVIVLNHIVQSWKSDILKSNNKGVAEESADLVNILPASVWKVLTSPECDGSSWIRSVGLALMASALSSLGKPDIADVGCLDYQGTGCSSSSSNSDENLETFRLISQCLTFIMQLSDVSRVAPCVLKAFCELFDPLSAIFLATSITLARGGLKFPDTTRTNCLHLVTSILSSGCTSTTKQDILIKLLVRLIAALSDPAPAVRTAALRSLKSISSPSLLSSSSGFVEFGQGILSHSAELIADPQQAGVVLNAELAKVSPKVCTQILQESSVLSDKRSASRLLLSLNKAVALQLSVPATRASLVTMLKTSTTTAAAAAATSTANDDSPAVISQDEDRMMRALLRLNCGQGIGDYLKSLGDGKKAMEHVDVFAQGIRAGVDCRGANGEGVLSSAVSTSVRFIEEFAASASFLELESKMQRAVFTSLCYVAMAGHPTAAKAARNALQEIPINTKLLADLLHEACNLFDAKKAETSGAPTPTASTKKLKRKPSNEPEQQQQQQPLTSFAAADVPRDGSSLETFPVAAVVAIVASICESIVNHSSSGWPVGGSSIDAIRALFDVLQHTVNMTAQAKAKISREEDDVDDEYFEQAIIDALAVALVAAKQTPQQQQQQPKKKKSGGDADEEIVNEKCIQSVMSCLKTCALSQTRNASIRLLAVMANISPILVVKNLRAILSFVGTHTLKDDDDYTHHVVQACLRDIIPVVLQHGAKVSYLLHQFASCIAGVPVHRRLRLLTTVVTVIGPSKSLAGMVALLLLAKQHGTESEGDTPNHGGSSFKSLCIALVRQFDALDQLRLVRILLTFAKKQRIEFYKSGADGEEQEEEEDDDDEWNTEGNKMDTEEDGDRVLHPAQTKEVAHRQQLTLLSFGLTCVTSIEPVILQKSAKEGDDEMRLIFCRCLEILRQSKNAADIEKLCMPVLKRLSELQSINGFVGTIDWLLMHKDEGVRRHAIQHLQAKLDTISDKIPSYLTAAAKGFLVLLQRLSQLVTAVVPSTSAASTASAAASAKKKKSKSKPEAESSGKSSTKMQCLNAQYALMAMELLSQRFANVIPDPFLQILPAVIECGSLSQSKVAVRSSALLCLASIVSKLSNDILPNLERTVRIALDAVKASGDNQQQGGDDDDEATKSENARLLLNSGLALLRSVVSHLSPLLSPYFTEIISCITLRHAVTSTDSLTIQLMQNIVETIPLNAHARLVIPAISACFSDVVARNCDDSIKTLLKIVLGVTSQMDHSSVSFHNKAVFKILMSALNIRALASTKKLEVVDVDGIENSTVECFLGLIVKMTEKMFRPAYLFAFDWSTETDVSSTEERSVESALTFLARQTAFFHLTQAVSLQLKALFVPYMTYVWEKCVTYLSDPRQLIKLPVGKAAASQSGKRKRHADDDTVIAENLKRSCVSQVLLAVHGCLLHDVEGFVDKEKYDALVTAMVAQIKDTSDGAEAYSKRIDDLVVPCVSQMVVVAGKEALWRPLNHAILMVTRDESPMIRFGAMRCVQSMVEKLRDDYLILLPESVGFIHELLEDDDQGVVTLTRDVVKVIESHLGESLQEYLS